MKKSFLFSYALAGMMLASCSSSDDVATGTHGFAEDGTGYVKVSLNLPTRSASSTRGVNDQTDDGEADEYKVNDATLIIFAGDNEADATFQSAYDLTGTVKEDKDNDQVTSQYTVTQKVNSVSSTAGSHIYAFVVLNHGDDMTLTNNVLYVNGTALTGKTFSEFSKMQVTSASTTTSPMINFEKDNIMMTNAVVTTSPGTAKLTAPTTLADVSTKIYSTEAEAKAAPAADIFVERMLAKVTLKCTDGTSSSTVTPSGGTASNFGYSLVGWELGNFNSNSYVSRQWDNSWNSLYSDGDGLTTHSELDNNKYRFAGINLIKEEAGNPSGDFYRTYFGMDANYGTDANFTDHPSTIKDLINPLTTDGVSYCYENTVNVPMMDAGHGKKNATTALIKMKLTTSGWPSTTGDFYTKDNIKGTIYTEDQAKKLVSNRFFTDFTDKAQLGALFTPVITENGDYSVNVTFSGDAGSQQYAVELVYTPISGTAKTKVLTNSDKYTTSAGTASILQTLQNNITITKFKNGYSYYKVLVKHFGDELTPWNKTTKTTATGMYPSNSEANYLGRYGVVRNNWYEITVSGVSSIGAATADELHVNDDSSSDDETTSYISCRINVLSWAKRTQSTVLGE